MWARCLRCTVALSFSEEIWLLYLDLGVLVCCHRGKPRYYSTIVIDHHTYTKMHCWIWILCGTAYCIQFRPTYIFFKSLSDWSLPPFRNLRCYTTQDFFMIIVKTQTNKQTKPPNRTPSKQPQTPQQSNPKQKRFYEAPAGPYLGHGLQQNAKVSNHKAPFQAMAWLSLTHLIGM